MSRTNQFATRSIMLAVSVFLLATLMFTTYQVRAATLPVLKVSCAITVVAGSVEVKAPFVRVRIFSADNLGTALASQVVPVNQFGTYVAALTYAPQPANSLLVISVGEWDGDEYLLPATIQSRPCKGPRR
jgi:hypothetical protein